MSTVCSPGEQAFAGGYVVLGTLSILSIVYECVKLSHRYCSDKTSRSEEPRWLFCGTLAFVLICVVSLIKCILYGLVHCDYIYLSPSFQETVFGILFQDLYAFQLYFFWMVLVLRLYCILQGTPYTLSLMTMRVYCGVLLCLPLTTPLMLSPDLGQMLIVLSFSISLFITLSITILYGFKLVQVYRYHSVRNARYVRQNGGDLVTIMTKNTILVLIATMFSFAILLILIFTFVIEVYGHHIPYQQQVCLAIGPSTL